MRGQHGRFRPARAGQEEEEPRKELQELRDKLYAVAYARDEVGPL